MNAKAKGNRKERQSRDLLEALGYRVTRAAASPGAFDLVGISSTDVVLMQVKSRDWPGQAEMEALRDFSCPPGRGAGPGPLAHYRDLFQLLLPSSRRARPKRQTPSLPWRGIP